MRRYRPFSVLLIKADLPSCKARSVPEADQDDHWPFCARPAEEIAESRHSTPEFSDI